MIQEELITETYPNRAEVNSVLTFLHDAAEARLDKVKYRRLGSAPPRGQRYTQQGESDKYLLRFQYETSSHYEERIRLCNCYGYTKIVADSYRFLFESAEKHLMISGITDEQRKVLYSNIDGNGNGIDSFAGRMFYNLLIDGQASVCSDMSKTGEPYLYQIPRENIRNFAHDDNGLAFLIHGSFKDKVEGIKTEKVECIYVFTRDEMAEYEYTDKGWNEVQYIENPFFQIPVSQCSLSDKTPLMQPLASIDLNMMNLDSEARSIIRNQAGLSFMVIPEEVDMDMLTDTTVISMPRGSDVVEPKWVAYPSHGLNAHFDYIRFLQGTLHEISRLRRQKSQAESGVSKSLDFTQTRAVLNAGADSVEKCLERAIKYYFAYLGQTVEVEYKIDRNFEVNQIDDEIGILIKLMSLDLGSTATAAAKKQFRDKFIKLDPDMARQSDDELMDSDDAFEVNAGINND